MSCKSADQRHEWDAVQWLRMERCQDTFPGTPFFLDRILFGHLPTFSQAASFFLRSEDCMGSTLN
jgi:hypothetical protein